MDFEKLEKICAEEEVSLEIAYSGNDGCLKYWFRPIEEPCRTWRFFDNIGDLNQFINRY